MYNLIILKVYIYVFFYKVASSNSDVIITPSTSYEFYRIISSGTVIVEFMNEWCSPCLTITPYYENLANKYSDSDTKFLMVNIDQLYEVMLNEHINDVPVFFVYKNGGKIVMLRNATKEKLGDLFVRWA